MIDLVIPLIFIYLPYIIFSFLSNFSYVEEKITQNIVKYVFRVISILYFLSSYFGDSFNRKYPLGNIIRIIALVDVYSGYLFHLSFLFDSKIQSK
uniref:Uncharacterized protein n=1 Tax=Lactococcus lactis subsp. cremoris TaxID=1359 RepID=A0A896TA12_LACLC